MIGPIHTKKTKQLLSYNMVTELPCWHLYANFCVDICFLWTQQSYFQPPLVSSMCFLVKDINGFSPGYLYYSSPQMRSWDQGSIVLGTVQTHRKRQSLPWRAYNQVDKRDKVWGRKTKWWNNLLSVTQQVSKKGGMRTPFSLSPCSLNRTTSSYAC